MKPKTAAFFRRELAWHTLCILVHFLLAARVDLLRLLLNLGLVIAIRITITLILIVVIIGITFLTLHFKLVILSMD